MRIQSLGRVALVACFLGILWGTHILLAVQLSLHQMGILSLGIQALGPDRVVLLWQWCAYVVVVCTFHMAEFFITALYNPSVTSADSFLVNHSVMYTAAALVRIIRNLSTGTMAVSICSKMLMLGPLFFSFRSLSLLGLSFGYDFYVFRMSTFLDLQCSDCAW